MNDPEQIEYFTLFLNEVKEDAYPGDMTLQKVLGKRSINEYVKYLVKETKFTEEKQVTKFFEKEDKIITETNLEVTLDLPQFFKFYKVINAKALSERIGINQSLLAQYIKGNKQPSPTQTRRILTGVQQVGKELAAIRFLL